MAVPNNYIDKIKKDGDSRMISPAADMVRVDNDNFEGTDLDEVLDEVAQAIGEAGEGGYAPPAGGIPKTDLSQDVQTSLDKADSALQDEDVAEVAKTGSYNDLNDKPTIPDTSNLATKTELATKQDALVAGNGIVIGTDGKTVSVADAIRTGAGKGATAVQSVTVESEEDGTVDIHVDDDTYTINLNHTHENMAKLVVCEESELPSTLDTDTIYGVEDSGEISMLYVGGIPFYGGGGGSTSEPILRQPFDDSTIEVGTIESGQSSVTKTIPVKGKNLTQALTVAVTGTGYSVNKQTISAADANVGTTLVITCTNTADNAAGTLSIASSEVSCDCDLVANVVSYDVISGVKFTGSQWLETDYYPNPNTEFEIDLRFIENVNSKSSSAFKQMIRCEANADPVVSWVIYNAAANGNKDAMADIIFNNDVGASSTAGGTQHYQTLGLATGGTSFSQAFLADHNTMKYENGATYATLSLAGASTLCTLKQGTNINPMKICHRLNNGADEIYNAFDLVIYEFTIKENDAIVRHWVPRSKAGVPGLLDTVSGNFISSKSSTELVPIS